MFKQLLYKNIGIFTPLLRDFYLVAITFTLFSSFFLGYVYLEKQIDQHNISRDQAMQQVDELRQSSADLRRMARSYVITLNPMYQRHYAEVLSIRDGLSPSSFKLS